MCVGGWVVVCVCVGGVGGCVCVGEWVVVCVCGWVGVFACGGFIWFCIFDL